ncbi:MAG: hypothetical protein ACW97A_11445 [Candidatus Thorarchaeota archaeon]|jgi:hypothetical protein
MEIKSYEAWNPKAIISFKLEDRLKQAFSRVDSDLRYIEEIMPEINSNFVRALKNRLVDVVDSYHFDTNKVNLNGMIDEFEHLGNYYDLFNLVLQFVCMELGLPEDFTPSNDEIEVFSLNDARALERLPYHEVKSCADVLGDKRGIKLWKKMIGLRLRDQRIEYEAMTKAIQEKGENRPTMAERRDSSIKRWIKIGLANFTVAVFDENKALYRFDKCHTHEALKDLNDPDFAYLCSCYIGDAPEYNFGRQFLRRTQTLHHGKFCDELYWMVDAYDNPEQPSLEFTQNLRETSIDGDIT